jgi:prefoldin alpha subunit
MEENNSEEEQEFIFKLQLYEQQINQLRQQEEAIDQAIEEIKEISEGLNNLVGGKDKEILAQIGKGIFAKAKLTSENLLVNIGNKNFVIRSIPETQKIIEGQIGEFNKLKEELSKSEKKINEKLQKLMNFIIEKEKNKK